MFSALIGESLDGGGGGGGGGYLVELSKFSCR